VTNTLGHYAMKAQKLFVNVFVYLWYLYNWRHWFAAALGYIQSDWRYFIKYPTKLRSRKYYAKNYARAL